MSRKIRGIKKQPFGIILGLGTLQTCSDSFGLHYLGKDPNCRFNLII